MDYTYDLYGNTTADANVNNPFQYTGRENDGDGLYYFRARYYSPTQQRFISQDPIGLNGGMNMYAYVGGNPLEYFDKTGLVRDKIDGNVITVHQNDVDPWPSDPHGHIYDSNQVVDIDGVIYNKDTGKAVGKIAKKAMPRWIALMKKVEKCAKVVIPVVFGYTWYQNGFSDAMGGAMEDTFWPMSGMSDAN